MKDAREGQWDNVSPSLVEILKEPDIIRATGVLLKMSLVSRGILDETALDKYLDVLGNSEFDLKERAEIIRERVLLVGDPKSRYEEIYKTYTSTTRIEQRVGMILPFLEDADSVIDIGTGNGGLALKLAEKYNKRVFASDVHDYRLDEVKKNPKISFVNSDNVASLGSAEGAFCSLVLHHVKPNNLVSLLSSVKKVLVPGGNFVILEETPPPDINDGVNDLSDTNLDKIFKDIGQEQSKKLLGVMDYISNWVANGVYDVPLPLNFHSIKEWRSIFEKADFRIKLVDYFGIPSLDKKFTPVPGARIVLES